MKKPRTEDDECYEIDNLDKVVQSATQELLDDDQLNNNLEEGIDHPNFKKCNHSSDSKTLIRRIEQMYTSYSKRESFASMSVGKTKRSDRLEDVTHQGNKSVILHTQDPNGGKFQAYRSTSKTFKPKSPRRG
nr:hypothetical protein [Tanacetum cinerariifolium]